MSIAIFHGEDTGCWLIYAMLRMLDVDCHVSWRGYWVLIGEITGCWLPCHDKDTGC